MLDVQEGACLQQQLQGAREVVCGSLSREDDHLGKASRESGGGTMLVVHEGSHLQQQSNAA